MTNIYISTTEERELLDNKLVEFNRKGTNTATLQETTGKNASDG